jgi:hypothetical protein
VVDAAREARVLSAASRAVAAAAHAIGVAPPPTTSRFYRAPMDAAVEVQQRELERSSPTARESLDLDTELRPALLRIGERMARLLVRVSALPVPSNLQARVHDALATHRLSDDRLEAIAEAIRSGMLPSQQGRREGPAVASLDWRQGW